MIQVFNNKSVLSESSSKGNQHKFYQDGYWIKLDNDRCHEGLAENFVSKFEALIHDFPFVDYNSEQIEYREEIYNGCYSLNMYNNPNISFISLRQLFRKNNVPLNIFIRSDYIEENMLSVINVVKELTGLDLSQYLFRTLLLDALIINEDRHYMNLGICTDGINFFEVPCFDNGSSLFCTNWTYRRNKSFEENMLRARGVARPFSKFFDKQVHACINLGAKPLEIDKNGLDSLMLNYYNPLYNDEVNNLIKSVLSDRLTYYMDKGIYKFV